MLVLSRKVNERIILVDDAGQRIAAVQIVRVRGDVVRLGIEAPDGVIVWREEIMPKGGK